MAIFSNTTSTGNYTIYLEVTETSYSEENNTSNVSATGYVIGASGTTAYGQSASYSCSLNGQVVSTGSNISFNMSTNKRISLFSDVKLNNIPHNADGTLSIPCSLYFNGGHSLVGTGTASGTLPLTTISRYSMVKFKVNGAFKNAYFWYKINGTWKRIKLWYKASGSWKESALRG